jgi:hypothetical protein
MGMGYGANYGWQASNKWLESLKLDGWTELKQYLLKYGEREVYTSLNCDEDLNCDENLTTAGLVSVWERVCNDFSAKTKLELALCYHDSSEEGDRYDEIDGLVYLVTKVVTFTKRGKEQFNAGNIRKVFWVTYG